MDTILHSDDILLLEYWEKALDKDCVVVDDIEKFDRALQEELTPLLKKYINRHRK